jgi:magnesium-transporting ATPase (P-type)
MASSFDIAASDDESAVTAEVINGGGDIALGSMDNDRTKQSGAPEPLTADMLSKADKERLHDKHCGLDEVLALLHADATAGLSPEEATRRAVSFGPNALEDKQRSAILVFLARGCGGAISRYFCTRPLLFFFFVW